MTTAREQDTQMTVPTDRSAILLLALEQIAAGSKPVTKAQGSLADSEMAAIAQKALSQFQHAQAPQVPARLLHQPAQTVSAATAHRLLGEMLAAQSVIQWLLDNDLLKSEASVDSLARQYAGTLKQQQDFLSQFDL